MRKSIGLGALAALSLLAIPSDAQYLYTGPVVARTSGATCRGMDAADDDGQGGQLLRGPGITNLAGTATVFCPIIRRNAAPYGQIGGGALADTVVNIQWMDVSVQQAQPASSSCTVYGTSEATGSTTWSAPLYTCLEATSGGCTTQQTPASGNLVLHFVDPLHGQHSGEALVNMGFTCQLAQYAGIIGSVAVFPTF
jgi:hypothetical protein